MKKLGIIILFQVIERRRMKMRGKWNTEKRRMKWEKIHLSICPWSVNSVVIAVLIINPFRRVDPDSQWNLMQKVFLEGKKNLKDWRRKLN